MKKLFLALLFISNHAFAIGNPSAAASPIIYKNGCAWNTITNSCVASGGATVWGDISGTIGNQLDLIAQFATKQNVIPYTTANVADNLSDLTSAATARTNLGLGSAAVQAASAFDPSGAAADVLATSLQAANNLSDLASAVTARTNLGLGSAATMASSAFDSAGAAAAVLSSSLQKASNLSDLASPSTARTNLGLAAVASTGAYSSLTGSPTNVSFFTNDAGYLTTAVASFNTRTGAITLTSSDVTTALGFTPPSQALTSAFIYVGNASNIAAGVAVSGDLIISNAGSFTIEKIQGTTVSGTTGTGNVAFSASPTFTGTAIAANITASGTIIVPTITSTAGAGTALSITGGSAASAGNGGQVTVAGASGSGTGAGGTGGNLNLNGGNANGNNTQNNSGGAVAINGGTSFGSSSGGTVTISSGTGGVGTGTGGATGGTTNVNGGTGGVGSATSGNGGGATLKAGSGGGGVAGGNGGTASLTGGTGGTGSASGGNGGQASVTGGSPADFAGSQGGSVSITSGNGTSTGSGGAGGSVTISSGQANGDNTTNYSGGSLTISIGRSFGSAGGANLTETAGQGGVGSGSAGANGGNAIYNAGNGGVGSATGGTGGALQFNAGTGGNSGTPGAGGIMQWYTASTTALVERLRLTATYFQLSGGTHLKTVQGTNPTATVNANAGSGATCAVTHTTDLAGIITIVSGSVGTPATGDQCKINFQVSYGQTPQCFFQPANSTAALDLVQEYMDNATSSSAGAVIAFSTAATTSATYIYNYFCVETQ